ncbi:MAG: anti-sigma factor [Chloroflexi bacterium]|nr:anti-sigma factor [Chloroflexota bacterium]
MPRPILALFALFFALAASPAYSRGAPVGQSFVRDDKSYSDRITLTMVGMSAIPRDKIYEAWLVTDNGLEQSSLGNLKVESDGTVRHSLTRDENFLARYNRVRISVEPRGKEDPKQAGETVVEGDIPMPVLAELRLMLVFSSDAPGGTALAVGIRTQTSLMLKHTNLAASALAGGDLGKAKENAEAVVNVVEGSRGPQYGDLNQDSSIQNPGDGYGLLTYIDKLIEHAEALASADGATSDVAAKVRSAEVAANNVANWAKAGRDDAAMLVLQGDSLDAAKPLLDNMTKNGIAALNGQDANDNGLVEPIEGEGGATTVYATVQSIARYDMHSVDSAPSGEQTGNQTKQGESHAGSKAEGALSPAPLNAGVIPIIAVGLLAGGLLFTVLALLWARSRESLMRQ